EVFFDDVRIPKDSVVGEVNDGWNVTMRALSYERGANALGNQAVIMREFEELMQLSKDLKSQTGTPIHEDSYFRQKLAQSYIEVEVLKCIGYKIADKLIKNQKITTESSVQKLFWSESHKRFGELVMEIQGLQG